MSLPPLLKHVYNYGTEEVVKRGKKIFHTHGVSLLDQDAFLEQIRFRVKNDVYQNYYTVTLQHFEDPKRMKLRCQCPYNLGEICRHEVAALFHLNDMTQAGYIAGKNMRYDQKHTVVRMRQPTLQLVQLFSGDNSFQKGKDLATDDHLKIIATKSGSVTANVQDEGDTYEVKLRLNEERYFDTSCSCKDDSHPLCMHKAALFLYIINTQKYDALFGSNSVERMKNLLLQQYGYSLEDDLTGKFSFSTQNGKPFLRVLDNSIKKISAGQAPPPKIEPVAVVEEKDEREAGIVFKPNQKNFPHVEVLMVTGLPKQNREGFSGPITHIDLVNTQLKNKGEPEQNLAQLLRKFAPDEVLRFIKKNIPFGEFYDDAQEVLKEKPEAEVVKETWSYLIPKYLTLAKKYAGHGLVFYTEEELINTKTLLPLSISEKGTRAIVHIEKARKGYKASLSLELGLEYVPYEKVQVWNDALYVYEEVLYTVKSEEDLAVISWFDGKGSVLLSEKKWPMFLEEQVMEWNKTVKVDFSEALLQTKEETKPGLRIYVEEQDRSMILRPVFVYYDTEVPHGNNNEVLYQKDGGLFVTGRNHAEEERWMHYLRNSHADIRYIHERKYFVLPEHQVLQNNWLVNISQDLQKLDVQLVGSDRLQKYKLTTAKVATTLRISSGVDWLDTQLQVSFGTETVPVEQIKQALLAKQNYVRLSDGSLGMLPKEWISRYGLMIKMAEVHEGSLRLKKVHYNILDAMLSEKSEDTIELEQNKKKEQLLNVVDQGLDIESIPTTLHADLRPYQIDGIKWLRFLSAAGWGGILADDMGLGKTIQALTAFLAYKQHHPEAILLVVCPTTLVYNWQNEITKFTPTLRHEIHHGAKRSMSKKLAVDTDIIITTYGTMRSDIKLLKEIHFHYVILDESQAIKNPQSQVAKAAMLLSATNKLALSGTPLQNNTFDLYAQMNFLNPGMLGSREFFMQQFATPIDKMQEEDIKGQLRKLVYPFILRRTKEQVAKDLPQKTETLLYCEMGDVQQKIYNTNRDMYRQQFLGMIDEQGIDKSRFHILQGLTRLRQICDSPSILNTQEKLPEDSVKLDELMRELLDNIGEHKALVFSQFLGMLSLIKRKLDEHGIPYAYFDGGSTVGEREKNIKLFQEQEEVKVFLISLKAGGVGLNLTAADYVYIIDPWWNPAVEQQAIDRTHRIGQTKNIFAYRLICKDTIEEKMLQLQESKKILAEELVGDDGTALKTLSREDISFLLS